MERQGTQWEYINSEVTLCYKYINNFMVSEEEEFLSFVCCGSSRVQPIVGVLTGIQFNKTKYSKPWFPLITQCMCGCPYLQFVESSSYVIFS